MTLVHGLLLEEPTSSGWSYNYDDTGAYAGVVHQVGDTFRSRPLSGKPHTFLTRTAAEHYLTAHAIDYRVSQERAAKALGQALARGLKVAAGGEV